MCLTARMMDAGEAERAGLVSPGRAAADCVDEAVRRPRKIAAKSRPVVLMAKEAVNRAYETTLAEGRAFRAPPVPRRCSPPPTRRKAWPPSLEKRPPDFEEPVDRRALDRGRPEKASLFVPRSDPQMCPHRSPRPRLWRFAALLERHQRAP